MTILLSIIYLAFISLGLPDSLLGSAWPVMHVELGVATSYAGIITMIISFGTILSSLMSDRLNKKFGTGLVTACSVFLTAAALFEFSCSNSMLALCLWAIPYGLGAGAVDAALNNYVALHYSSRQMSWLHCMWGVGAAISPYIMSFCLTRQLGWQQGGLSNCWNLANHSDSGFTLQPTALETSGCSETGSDCGNTVGEVYWCVASSSNKGRSDGVTGVLCLLCTGANCNALGKQLSGTESRFGGRNCRSVCSDVSDWNYCWAVSQWFFGRPMGRPQHDSLWSSHCNCRNSVGSDSDIQSIAGTNWADDYGIGLCTDLSGDYSCNTSTFRGGVFAGNHWHSNGMCLCGNNLHAAAVRCIGREDWNWLLSGLLIVVCCFNGWNDRVAEPNSF